MTNALLQEDTGMIQLDRRSGVSWQESLPYTYLCDALHLLERLLADAEAGAGWTL